MRILLVVFLLLAVMAEHTLAGSEYETCISEEKRLKTLESSECSGLRQLLNPSACYATQRVLKEYKAGKCKKIGIAENVDFSVPRTDPEKKTVSTNSLDQKKVETEVPRQESTTEQLKEENLRLKAEIGRLKAENELLKKTNR